MATFANQPDLHALFPGRVGHRLIFAVIAVLLLGLNAFQLYTSYQAARRATGTDAANLARVLESKLHHHLIDARQTVEMMVMQVEAEAMRRQFAAAYRPKVEPWLQFLAGSNSSLAALHYFDAAGDGLYSSRDDAGRFSIAARAFYKTLKDDSSRAALYSEVVVGQRSGRPLMLVGKAIRNRQGIFLGAAAAAIDLASMREDFRTLELGSDGVVSMRRLDDGAAVVRYPAQPIDANPHGIMPIRQALLTDRAAGTMERVSPVDGIKRIFSYRPVGDLPFFVLVGISTNEALAAWRQSAAISLGATLLFLGALGGFFFRLASAEERRDKAAILLQANRQSLHEAQQIACLGSYNFDIPADRWTSNDILDGIFGIDAGYRRDVQHWLELVAPADRAAMKDYLASIMRQRTDFDREYRIVRHKDRRLRWVHGKGKLQYDADGNPLLLQGVIQDITERRLAEESVRASEERYRIAFSTSGDAININRLDDGRYVDVNQGFERVMGWRRDEVLGKTSVELGIWVDPFDRLRMVEMLKRNDKADNLEFRFRCKDGRVLIGLMSVHTIMLDGVPCILSVTHDITERKASEAEIRRLAFYDSLTELPNRQLLLDRLRHALAASARSGRQFALLILDLDNFKTLNDSLGHHVGDLLLQQVAQRLRECVREGDTVARLGGDEFVVMLEDLSAEPQEAAAQAEMIGKKILDATGSTYQLGEYEYRSTASVGITLFSDHEETTEDQLKRADLAMYQAKAAGRNTLRFFDPQMQAAVTNRAALEADMRDAVARNQLVLHFQPQADHAGRMTGAEALLRWQHPQRGLVPPLEFIPLAEDNGLIVPFGLWVLETACRQLARWAPQPALGALSIAVNVSARQVHNGEFVEQVLAVLQQTGAPPNRLKLELTESLLLQDVEGVIAKMNALRAHGVGFSLDDFGTGYSSLSYLKRLPLDELKIDRTFVRDILVDPDDAAIARMIIALAGSLGLAVIAEGVETAEQREFLAREGCHHYQGYLFSRPLPLEGFERFAAGIAMEKS